MVTWTAAPASRRGCVRGLRHGLPLVPPVEQQLIVGCSWLTRRWPHLDQDDVVLVKAMVGRYGDARWAAMTDAERASATPSALPGELTGVEGRALIDQVASFGRPFPILIVTGGDCLLRPDVFALVDYATSLGIPVAMSPCVTPMLTDESIQAMVDRGVKAVSLSLDGASAATHDGVRGIPKHFDDTIPAIRPWSQPG